MLSSLVQWLRDIWLVGCLIWLEKLKSISCLVSQIKKDLPWFHILLLLGSVSGEFGLGWVDSPWLWVSSCLQWHYWNDQNETKWWQVGMGLAFAHSESHSRSEGYLEWGTQGHWKCEVRCGDFNESRGHHPLCNKWGQALVDYILRLHVEREHG